MQRTGLLIAAGVSLLFCAGCVVRRFTIDSFPQGATVYRDGKPIGVTPVDDTFVYYGTYRFTLVKDGFETHHIDQKVSTPWYCFPPLDFFTENIWPMEVKDHRRFSYPLSPMVAVNENDAINRAEMLRARGRSLQPLSGPVDVNFPTSAISSGLTLPVPEQPSVGVAPGTVPLPPVTNGGSDGASRSGP